MTYDLGQHILTIQQEQGITIENEALVIYLDGEETYKLLQVLQALFMQQEQETDGMKQPVLTKSGDSVL